MKSDDSWTRLKEKTSARIALGRAGGSLPTKAWLDFRLAHAKARDAVFKEFDISTLVLDFKEAGITSSVVESCADNIQEFLLRPDKGRRLTEASIEQTSRLDFARPEFARKKPGEKPVDGATGRPRVGVILSAGLSALAAMVNGPRVILSLVPDLAAAGFDVSPIFLNKFGRVALGDHIAQILNIDLSIILIGERPGLDTAESLGAYVTYSPSAKSTDADRNCVSNIHGRGLSPAVAAKKILWITKAAIQSEKSGVMLKDHSEEVGISGSSIFLK